MPSEDEKLEEMAIDTTHKWCNRVIEELNLRDDELIALIIRNDETIIPDGRTKILENDTVVLYR